MRKTKKIISSLLAIITAFSVFILPTGEARAVSFTPISTNNAWVSGNIGTEDEVDFYSVRLSSAGWLTVDYQGLSVRDSYIKIFNYELTKEYCGHEVYYSSDIDPKNRTDCLALEPGTYAIKIYSRGSNVGGYRVKTSFKAANNNESSNNNSFSTAQTLSNGETVKGFLSEDDELDFYKINLNSPKTIRFICTSYIDYKLHFQIWNKDYVEVSSHDIWYASEDDPKTYVYEEYLPAGTYYVKMYQGHTGRYTLKYEYKTPVKNISISGNKRVVAGNSFRLKATVSPSNATDKSIEWSSGDTWIADVNDNGKVTTHRAGKVNITASAQDGSNKTKVVSVIVLPKKIKSLSGYKYRKRTASLSWSSESGVSGYQIQYSKYKSFKNAKTKRVKYSYAKVSKLSSKKYYFRVRGYVKSGKKYYYGAWSKRKSVKMR